MNDFEYQIAWVVFVWILVSSLLFARFEDRLIVEVKDLLGERAASLKKNTFLDPGQNVRNLMFFFKYKSMPSDSEYLEKLIRKGRYLNICYLAQLSLIGIFMVVFFEAKVA